jgi:hypothetical protein
MKRKSNRFQPILDQYNFLQKTAFLENFARDKFLANLMGSNFFPYEVFPEVIRFGGKLKKPPKLIQVGIAVLTFRI